VRRTFLLVVASVLVAACTGGPTGSTPSSADGSTGQLPPDGPRLLVLGTDGNLLTVDPSGGDRIQLTTRAGPDLIETQAVGSPNGRSIAWVEIDPTGPSLHTASRFGQHDVSIRLAFAPFYLLWDPTSSKVLYLGNAGAAIGLGIVDRAVVQPRDIAVGGGAPLYPSWSPDGTHILVHVGNDVLGTSDLIDPLERIDRTPGVFQAPVWLPDGGLVYAIRRGGHQALVIDRDGALTTLARFDGGTLFTVDPTGRRIAYRLDRPDGTQEGLYMRPIEGGEVRLITRRRTTAFFWSPTGASLLLMTPAPGKGDPTTHRWRVWSDHGLRTVSPPFVPSTTFFQGYAPFFDQYAQSLTPWSPTGDAFAFAGSVDGRPGIWVDGLDGSGPVRVADGSMVSWLPDDEPTKLQVAGIPRPPPPASGSRPAGSAGPHADA
jgi:Tol biopolymer transport system component